MFNNNSDIIEESVSSRLFRRRGAERAIAEWARRRAREAATMVSPLQKRLQKELQQLMNEPPHGVKLCDQAASSLKQ